MSDATWIATTARLPADGQNVLVKTAHGVVEHRVTFRVSPEPRWESRHFISELVLVRVLAAIVGAQRPHGRGARCGLAQPKSPRGA